MKSVYRQWVQRGVQSLNSLLMTTSGNSSKQTNWQRISKKRGFSSACQETAPTRKQMARRPEQQRGLSPQLRSTPRQSLFMGSVPPEKGVAGERKLKQPPLGRQLEAVSKTAVGSKTRWTWTGRVCLWAVPPPGDWAPKRGSESLSSPFCPCLRRRVGIASAMGRDDPT